MNALDGQSYQPQYQKYYDTLNFKDIEFPVQADEIVLQRFERQNPSIALCISKWKGKLSLVYVTDKKIAERRQMINLFLHWEIFQEVCANENLPLYTSIIIIVVE